MKALSVLGYLGMVASLLFLAFTGNLFSFHPAVVVVQFLAAALMLWARAAFGRRSFHAAANPTAGGLVTSGPYRHIRHPIYTAVCLFTVAGVAAHWSWKTTLALGGMFACVMVRMLFEEKLVSARYPEYQAYAAKTRRMIPCIF